MRKTFIIAEAGVSHNGDILVAKEMVNSAVAAGADAVKFQTFKADYLVTKFAPKVKYQIDNTGNCESQFQMLKRVELSKDAHEELISYCVKKDIIFMSTPFDEESADMLDRLGMNIFKIPSGEITNKQLLQHIASKNKDIILSTGMSYLAEVDRAVSWINEVWNKSDNKPQLTLLHCVTSYPASIEDSNLLAIKTMEKAFKLPIGYSDHTLGIEVPIAAVVTGAIVIEKHFTIDRDMKGPDHKASIEPDELKAMVSAIRNIEKAMGDGIKKPKENEKDIRNAVRRSLVANRDIKLGKTILPHDIAIKRPGTGIPPEFKEVVIGMKAEKDITFDSVIRWNDFKNA